MGLGVRVHFFEDDGSITRIPYARFGRLLSQDTEERIPAYAGKKVRTAMTLVELKQRKPVKIVHTDFMLVTFGSDGSVDFEEHARGASLAMNMLDLGTPGQPDNVIDLVPHISRKRYEEEFTWTPTGEEFDLLVRDVLP